MSNKHKILIVAAVFLAIMAIVAAKQLKYQKTASELKSSMDEAVEGLPTLLELGSHSCRPCRMMTPILKELDSDHSDELNVVFIDVNKSRSAVEKYNIRVIPVQIFFGPEGKQLFRHEGFYPKEDIIKKWSELGYNLK